MTPRRIVVLGLSLSSSWGNGHATTYRALVRGLKSLGHDVLFLERDVPWYAAHRDLSDPDFCTLRLYDSIAELATDHAAAIAEASAVLVGSYVPDGIAVLDLVLSTGRGVRAFYDIDTPVTLAALAQHDAAYLARRQIPLLDLYLSFSGGPVLQRLEQEHGARCARPLYCSVDAALYQPQDCTPAWDLGYLGTYSADRQPVLERLLLEPARHLPHCRFVVAGPQYPDDVAWPANVERIAHLPPARHADFYNRQRYTLNVTRADMVATGWSPSVRLFEAAACGTPIISDHWDGLTALLPEPGAIRLAWSATDVVDVLMDGDDCRRVAQSAMARSIVLADHTGEARGRDLIDYIDQADAARCNA